MKKIFCIITIVIVLAMVFGGCTGKSNSTQNVGNNAPVLTNSNTQRENNDSLFDISKNDIMVTSSLNKDTVLAEIPTQMLKGIGKVNSVDIWADTIGNFKYVLVLKFYVNSNENAVKILMDYYKSIGANVEETGNRYNPYSVTFEWGESTEIKFGSFEGQDYIDMQFGVVQK